MPSDSIIIKLFYPNQTRYKFEKKKMEKYQNFTILENFQFFFKIFLDSLTIRTEAQHCKNVKKMLNFALV